MAVAHRIGGAICAVGYALQRSKIGFLRLSQGLLLLTLVASAYSGLRWWLDGSAWPHVAVISLCLLLVCALLWARQRGYLVFLPSTAPAPSSTVLRPEQKLLLRGCGVFEVDKARRYLVEVPVVFWTTRLDEHIVAAKVRAPSLLGIVGVPSAERGWWYLFLEPRRVVEIVPGWLHFALRVRPAVRVAYRTDKSREVVYVSCGEVAEQALLLHELESKVEQARGRHEKRPGSG